MILDFILHRYSDSNYVLSMDLMQFCDLYQKGKEMEQKTLLHDRYCSMLVGMSIGTIKYISWQDYYDKATGKNIDTRPTNIIIAELEEQLGRKLV